MITQLDLEAGVNGQITHLEKTFTGHDFLLFVFTF